MVTRPFDYYLISLWGAMDRLTEGDAVINLLRVHVTSTIRQRLFPIQVLLMQVRDNLHEFSMRPFASAAHKCHLQHGF